MAHSGCLIKCKLLGGIFITDFGQENHTLEEEKAYCATSSIPTDGVIELYQRADGTSVVQKPVDFSPYFLGELLDLLV